MINATAVHAFELDDVGPGGHNGSVTLSSALAMAQHGVKLSGAGLINALVVGVETAARVGNCVGRVPHEGLGFHGPGIMGTFASVASASNALGLDAEQLVHALGCHGGAKEVLASRFASVNKSSTKLFIREDCVIIKPR